MDILKLEKEVDMQTRNGRDDVYLLINDIQQLEISVNGKSTLKNNYGDGERMYIKADYIYHLIYTFKRNKFKNDLKVETEAVNSTIISDNKKEMEKERGE